MTHPLVRQSLLFLCCFVLPPFWIIAANYARKLLWHSQAPFALHNSLSLSLSLCIHSLLLLCLFCPGLSQSSFAFNVHSGVPLYVARFITIFIAQKKCQLQVDYRRYTCIYLDIHIQVCLCCCSSNLSYQLCISYRKPRRCWGPSSLCPPASVCLLT